MFRNEKIQITHNDPEDLYEDPRPINDEEIIAILLEENRVVDYREEAEPGCIFDAWPEEM